MTIEDIRNFPTKVKLLENVDKFNKDIIFIIKGWYYVGDYDIRVFVAFDEIDEKYNRPLLNDFYNEQTDEYNGCYFDPPHLNRDNAGRIRDSLRVDNDEDIFELI